MDALRKEQIESKRRRPGFLSRCCRRLARRLLRKPAETVSGPSTAVPATIVGLKKTAVYRDYTGQFRVIEFFLPADLVTKLRRPIEIQFLEGEELVTAQQFGQAINSGFLTQSSSAAPNSSTFDPAK